MYVQFVLVRLLQVCFLGVGTAHGTSTENSGQKWLGELTVNGSYESMPILCITPRYIISGRRGLSLCPFHPVILYTLLWLTSLFQSIVATLIVQIHNE